MAEIKFEHSLTFGQQQTSISKIVCKSAQVLDHKNTTKLLYLSATIFFYPRIFISNYLQSSNIMIIRGEHIEQAP